MWSIFYGCFFVSIGCFSQANYKHYTSSDGLPHDVAYNIIQDSKGYIWIGTDDGLTRYNGDNFKNYTLNDGLTSNYVTDIEELSNDKFAIATWGGGLHFLENDSIYKSEGFNDKTLKIYDIKHHQKKIHTYSGVSNVIYDLNKEHLDIKVFLKKTNSFSLYRNRSDTLYKLSPVILNGKLYVHNKEISESNFLGIHEFLDYRISSAFSFLSPYNITAATEGYNNEFVFGALDTLIFADTEKITTKLRIPNITPFEFIHKILKVPGNINEYILIIQNRQREKRVVCINIETQKFIEYEDLLNLKTTISDAIFDFEGNLWISTFGDGVYCYYYSNPKIKIFCKGEYIIDLIASEDKIYAQAASKFHEFSRKTLLKSFNVDGFPKQLSKKNGEITLAILSENLKQYPKFNSVNGRFFLKTKFGDFRQSDSLFLDSKPLMISNEILINKAVEESDRVSFYTNKGKWKYIHKDRSFSKDTLFSRNLVTENIRDFISKGDVTYLATDRGLVVRTKDSIKVYNEKNGLQNERINCILIHNNIIYLGTQGGLSVIRDNVAYNFSKLFGIQSLAINKIVCVNDELWLGGNNGISVIKTEDIKTSISPKINVTQEQTKFTYDVISFKDRSEINSQYRINRGSWVDLKTSNGVIDFANYAPNNYTVEFRSQNSFSPWTVSEKFSFDIKLPWYKVWWVITIFVLSGFSLVILFFYSRLKIVSRRNAILRNEIDRRIVAEKELSEVRHNIARDFHDDLGNKLASISLMSDVLSNNIASNNAEAIATIKNDADYLYKGTKDFIFSLQEKSNYLGELQVYLTDFADDYLHQFGVDFEVESSIESNIKLPYYWGKQIIYIFKEAITNVVKHSDAKLVKMSFNADDKNLCITLADDGKGFDIEKVSGNGLSNMQSRSKKINCSLEVQSIKETGTSVKLIGILPQKGS